MKEMRVQLPRIVLGIVLCLPPAAGAQQHSNPQPTWAIDVGVAGANVVAGALTAAATAAIRGQAVAEAFLKGAVGGGVVYVGKRVAVEPLGGTGLLGRQIAGVGSSIVANGGAGNSWLSEVWLPLGPAWIQVVPEARRQVRVNLADVGAILWAATRSELRFDVERSLSNGSAVFVAPGHRLQSDEKRVGGLATGGVVVLGYDEGDIEQVQRHENVHVIQHDYLLHTIGRPFERSAWSRITHRSIPVDIGLLPLFRPPVLRSLHQREAEALESR